MMVHLQSFVYSNKPQLILRTGMDLEPEGNNLRNPYLWLGQLPAHGSPS